jgi:MFS family permease
VSPTFSALQIRNYRIYAAGAVVSNTGTWMQRVAQDWLVLLLSAGSGTALGITTGLQFLPALLLSPLAGVVADRYPKQRVLVCTQIAMVVPAAVLGLLAITGQATTEAVYALALLLGVGSAFDAPARQSFVVEMVGPDDLANAVGLNSASFNAARVVGPALAGVLIAAGGSDVTATGWVILANALSYLAVVWSLTRLRIADLRPSTPVERGKGAVREGVRYVRGRPDLMLILAVVFFAGTFGLNFQMTSALMATEVYGKGASEYGLLGSVMAIGSLTGALVAARRSKPSLRLVVGAAVAFSAVEVAAGLMPTYLWFAIWVPLVGLTALTMITAANATIQLSVDPQMRGRVAALYLMIFMGGTPLGSPFIGWLGEVAGARWTLIGGGLITLVGVLGSVAAYVWTQGVDLRLLYRRVAHPARDAREAMEQEREDEAANAPTGVSAA